MRILYLDIDTLRPDHLGCYGYHRATSPTLDRLAAEGTRFENVYVSDAPCLPSRASMFTGCFGIHTGVVDHGGTGADPRPVGPARGFKDLPQRAGLVWALRGAGFYPVSISPFAERHSSWWFYSGWQEMYNTGRSGLESGEEITPVALDWIARNARRDGWMLHVNLWDPHTPYRAPEGFGNPFRDDPPPAWYTEELRRKHWESFGPHDVQDPNDGGNAWQKFPRVPRSIASLDDYRRWIDGYDCGIRYADENCRRILEALEAQGVLEDTLIVVTSDHGENQGELNVYGDHHTADHVTSRVPFLLRLPGRAAAGRVDDALHYQNDLGATLVELAGGTVPSHWDGRSVAQACRAGRSQGRPYVVFSQNAWSCQRAVRWDHWVFIRTYHTGLKDFPARMLFNIADDPHELTNLASARPELADHGAALIEEWTADMLASSASDTDPMWTTMREGGPLHTRGPKRLAAFCDYLRRTGRAHHAQFLQDHPTGLRPGQ